jgi:hypothetical protein
MNVATHIQRNMITNIVETIAYNFCVYEELLKYFILLYLKIPRTEEYIHARFLIIFVINKLNTKITLMYTLIDIIDKLNEEKTQTGGALSLSVANFFAWFLMGLLYFQNSMFKSNIDFSNAALSTLELNLTKITTEKIRSFIKKPEINTYSSSPSFYNLLTQEINTNLARIGNYNTNKPIRESTQIITDEQLNELVQEIINEMIKNENMPENVQYIPRPKDIPDVFWKSQTKSMMTKFNDKKQKREKKLLEMFPDSKEYVELLSFIHSPICDADKNGVICLSLFTSNFKKQFTLPLGEYLSQMAIRIQESDEKFVEQIPLVDTVVKSTAVVGAVGVTTASIIYSPEKTGEYAANLCILMGNTGTAISKWFSTLDFSTKMSISTAAVTAGPEMIGKASSIIELKKENTYVEINRWITNSDHKKLKNIMKEMKGIDFFQKEDIMRILNDEPHSEGALERQEQHTFINMLKSSANRMFSITMTTGKIVGNIARTSHSRSKKFIKDYMPRETDLENNPIDFMINQMGIDETYDIQAIGVSLFILFQAFVLCFDAYNNFSEVKKTFIYIMQFLLSKGFTLGQIYTMFFRYRPIHSKTSEVSPITSRHEPSPSVSPLQTPNIANITIRDANVMSEKLLKNSPNNPKSF